MTTRAKFNCSNVTPNNNPDDPAIFVELEAVTADTPENKTWSKWTPSGKLTMNISNPEAFGNFEQGKEYFIDVTPAG